MYNVFSMNERETQITDPTKLEISNWELMRERIRRDFELNCKPVLEELDRWRRESAAGKRNRPGGLLKAAA